MKCFIKYVVAAAVCIVAGFIFYHLLNNAKTDENTVD